LCDANPVGGAGTWNRDGIVLFGDEVIYRVPAAGGVRTPVTALDKGRGDLGHSAPRFLPDGRHFLFRILNRDPEQSAVYLGALDSSDTQLLDRINSRAEYAPPGSLLFARDGTLMARPFDPGRRQWTGCAFVLSWPIVRLLRDFVTS